MCQLTAFRRFCRKRMRGWASLLFVCGASGNTDCAATTGAKNCAAPPPEMSKVSKDRVQGALWGLLAGDALASPTHWYYGGLRQVQGDYGRQGIRDYTKPVAEMQGSIMPRSNTDGAGRGSYNEDRKTVIGDVINHGKKPYWNPRTSFHYHGTLAAGENTLEAQLSRLLVRTIAARGGVDDAAFRDAYVAWMTTPGSHNDSYASTCHRMFFANYVHGRRDPADCPDNDRHNVDTIDGLVLPSVAAVAAAYGGGPGARAEAVDAAVRVARVTRDSKPLEQAAAALAGVLFDSVHGVGTMADRVDAATDALGMSRIHASAPDEMIS